MADIVLPIVLPFEPLTGESFGAFGEVVEKRGSQHYTINNGTCERYHDLATIDVADVEGKPIVSIFSADPVSGVFQVSEMERHPLGSQLFFPLEPCQFVVVAAPEDWRGGVEGLRCFITEPGQGVNYRKGVWHHPLLVLEQRSDFLVVDRGGPESNCDLVQLPSEPRVVVDIEDLADFLQT